MEEVRYGSCELIFSPENTCDWDGCDEVPVFTWNEGDYSDWNGGARFCPDHAESTVRAHIQHERKFWDGHPLAGDRFRALTAFEQAVNEELAKAR